MTSQNSSPIVEHSFIAMGTPILISLALDREADSVRAAGAIDEVERLMQSFGREAWAWGDGALAQMNRQLAAGAAASIPPDLRDLFARAAAIQAAAEGLFEPRIGALVRLWGFDGAEHTRTEPPPQAEIETWLARIRAAPPYDGGKHYGPAAVIWDFGAIGKGYIVDAALALLRRRGFDHALINAGGNVAVRGARNERAWRVGIRDPRHGGELPQILAALDARDEAVVTHGDDQRFFDHAGRRYAHLLDPRTGMPTQGLRSLTVVHADGTLADAGGAALFVAGRDGWPRLAAKLGIALAAAVTADGTIQVSADLRPRLRLAPDLNVEAV